MKKYSLFYNNGKKKTVETDNIRQYETDDLNFYISEDNLNRFNCNRLLNRWEGKLIY